MQAQLAQQTRQIGIMKAVGGQFGQVLGVYYAMVVAYGVLALAIGLPLGILAAGWMSNFMATLVNFDLPSLRPSTQVLLMELAVGLLVPVLAALYPILSAVRISAARAMSDYGISNLRTKLARRPGRAAGAPASSPSTNPGPRPRTPGLGSRFFSRPLLLSLRNTFRRRGRLALTLTTLILAGGIFIAVFTVKDSLTLTLSDMYNYIEYDVYASMKRPYRIDYLQRLALEVPGVKAAESWGFASTRRIRPDKTESETVLMYAPNADSPLVHPTVVEGRWLLPADDNAVVVNTLFLKDEPDVKVGDEITLKISGDDTKWRVVGIMKGTPPMPMAYANYPYLAKLQGFVGRSPIIFTVTDVHDPASQSRIAQALEDHFEATGVGVSSTQTSASERGQIQSQFNVLVIFLLIMAVLLAVVGGIGLMGTMSLNVIERTREIGVMRAVGATGLAISQIVIVEGMLIGLISWAVGTLLAYPLSTALCNMVGNSILRAPLSYTFSIQGAGLWLVIAMVLSALASLLPARSASRVSVREVLAYE
jgi:putative ABC transport system permease protein